MIEKARAALARRNALITANKSCGCVESTQIVATFGVSFAKSGRKNWCAVLPSEISRIVWRGRGTNPEIEVGKGFVQVVQIGQNRAVLGCH